MTPTTEYRLIPLTQGQSAIVDAADFEWLSQFKWYALRRSDKHSFYAARGFWSDNKMRIIFMHRAILGLDFGDKRQGDHQNRDPLDNRRANLRIATVSQNAYNRGAKSNTISGFKGVSWSKSKKRWFAGISVRGRHKIIGRFLTAEEAYAAYCEAAVKLHGEFARLS